MKNEIRNHSHMSREARIVQGYDFLCRYTDEHGYPPTVRELGKELGYTSKSSAFALLKELEQTLRSESSETEMHQISKNL